MNQQLPSNLRGTAANARRWFQRACFLFVVFVAMILILVFVPSFTKVLQYYSVLGGIALLLSVTIGSLMVACFVVWVANVAPIDNFKRSQKFQADLERLIAAHKPYGFYLRDFRSETIPIVVSDFGLTALNKDPVEHTLVKQLCRHLPFFALLNPADSDEAPIAHRIYCDSDSWFDTLVRYADGASLFVVNTDSLSEAIMRELDWIFQPDRKGRALIVAPPSIVKQVRDKYPRIDDQHWLLERSERKADHGTPYIRAPETVLKFVRSLVLEAKPTDE